MYDIVKKDLMKLSREELFKLRKATAKKELEVNTINKI